MLNLVEVRSSQGNLLVLSLTDASNGFIVADIEGLDPVKATIVSSSFARVDGTQYQASRREERNIKLKVELEPDYVVDTVRDLRHRLYAYFMPKSVVGLKFYDTNGLIVDISGRVETCQSALFTKEPTMDISIICFDPDFYDPTPVQISGMTTATETETLLEYNGTVDTGITFVLNVDRTLSEFTIYHRPPNDETRTLEFSAPLVAGDVLTISTVSGDKGATLARAGTTSSILYGISPQSNWTELMSGDNYIRVYAEGAGVPFEIEYLNKYGGL